MRKDKQRAVEAMRELYRFAGLEGSGDAPAAAVERLAKDPEERAWLFELSCPKPPRPLGLDGYRDDDEDQEEDLWNG